jgi:hypothetical protein
MFTSTLVLRKYTVFHDNADHTVRFQCGATIMNDTSGEVKSQSSVNIRFAGKWFIMLSYLRACRCFCNVSLSLHHHLKKLKELNKFMRMFIYHLLDCFIYFDLFIVIEGSPVYRIPELVWSVVLLWKTCVSFLLSIPVL